MPTQLLLAIRILMRKLDEDSNTNESEKITELLEDVNINSDNMDLLLTNYS